MSADANSAFGSALSGNRRHIPRTDGRDDSNVLQPQSFAGSSPTTGNRYTDLQAEALGGSSEWADQPFNPYSPQASAVPGVVEDWFDAILAQFGQTIADQVTPVRLAGHITVLLVATVVLVLSQVEIPDWNFSLRTFPNSSLLSSERGNVISPRVAGLIDQSGNGFSVNESLQRAAVPFTVAQSQPTPEIVEIETYTVRQGDTILGIAERYGLRPETVQWSNPGLEVNADLIRPGDRLRILPIDGAVHVVTSGDTLSSIAQTYEVTVNDIVGYAGNGLADSSSPIAMGASLVIPNGTKPNTAAQQIFTYSSGSTPVTAKLGSGTFLWPTSGSINQRYWSGHAAIDIGAWTGAPVTAADSGFVAVSRGGWNGGYGNHVIVDHGNGFVTLYAHLNSIYVKQGENVVRGQQIGSVGNTGNSTGPHLHLEIRYQGAPLNPLNYLP